jgi:hypothetical protein
MRVTHEDESVYVMIDRKSEYPDQRPDLVRMLTSRHEIRKASGSDSERFGFYYDTPVARCS